jgi:hypothetical protein
MAKKKSTPKPGPKKTTSKKAAPKKTASQKPAAPAPPARLTDEQVEHLGDLLIDTRKNVYEIAQQEFGISVGDDIFDRLKNIDGGDNGMFKCVECNTWFLLDAMSGQEDVCFDCSAEEEKEEEEEDESEANGQEPGNQVKG